METGDDGDLPFKWRAFASCRGLAYNEDTNPFFKEGRGEVYKIAREFCARCPVVIDCLLDGLDDTIGFRGGTSVNERATIRRSLRLGMNFRNSVEEVWEYHRHSGVLRAPEKSIWSEWT
jgi:hypothetical protein